MSRNGILDKMPIQDFNTSEQVKDPSTKTKVQGVSLVTRNRVQLGQNWALDEKHSTCTAEVWKIDRTSLFPSD